MKPTMQVTVDLTKNLKDLVAQLQNREVLVGVPESEDARPGDDEFGNAAIMYIAENGSAANNTPARRPMSTGIQRAKPKIVNQMKACAKAVLDGKPEAIDTYLGRVGTIASNQVKLVIDEQDGMAPPAPSTLKARRRRGFMGEKSYLVTGQLRNSITYVVGERKR